MRKTLALILVAFAVSVPVALCAAASGAGVPATVMLDSLVDKYEAVRFDHATHVAYFAKSCGDCHHQHENYSSQPCKGCHSLDTDDFKKSASGGFISCRSCHGAFDPASPGMPGLKVAYHKQCFGCHRDAGDVGQSPEGCAKKCHARREAAQ